MDAALKSFTQVGFAVRDLDKVVENMHALFSITPSFGTINCKVLYREEATECEAQIAYFQFANIELEFVMPLGGISIW